MADLRELTTDAKRLYEALDYLLEKQETAGVDDIDFNEIWFSAKARSFSTHILGTLDDVESRRYLLILSALIALADDSSKKTVQIRFLARLLASCKNVTMDLKELVADGLLFQDKNIDEFQELKKDDVRICLLIDLLLLSYLDGDCDEKQLDFAIGFMALIGLDKEKTKAVGMIVKGILEQNDDLVFAQRKYFNVEWVYCYMKELPLDGIRVYDLEDAKNLKARKIIFFGIEWKAIPEIDLDGFLAEEIEFRNCTFREIEGMSGITKKVTLRNCFFSDCVAENWFLYISKARIIDCKFSGINMVKRGKGEYLFTFFRSEILRTKFEDISILVCPDEEVYIYTMGFMNAFDCNITEMIVTELEMGPYGLGADRNVIKVEGGRMYDCEFNNWKVEKKVFAITGSEDAEIGHLKMGNIDGCEWLMGRHSEKLKCQAESRITYEDWEH